MSTHRGSIKPTSSTDSSNPIRKKVESLVSQKLHTDQDFLKMVDYVAPMLNKIDIHVERRLTYELEERKIKANREYLKAFGLVNDQVQDFVAKVMQLNSICQDMTNKIQLNKAKTQDLLARTAALQNEKQTLERKQIAIDDFLSRYSLTPEEETALKGSEADGTVNAKFFAALQRVKQIHDDSKQLLRSSGEHLAALEIMEEMANKLEEAYEVLYRSIQRECRLLNVEFLELKGVLVQSIASLQDREVLFNYALDEYTTARRNYLVRAYIDALTRGGAGGTPKPIELLSHDPLRYISDMLAWIHQAMATERELLQALLKLCNSDVLKEKSTGIQSQISEALCRPFKVRVEQALTTETNCIVLYRLSCLFTFYLETMSSSLNSDSMLIQTFKELKELTLNLFFSGLHSLVQKLVGKMGTPDYDLLPVFAVHQVLVLLKDVLESHDGGVAAVADKKENFEKIFTAILDPLNQAVQLSATQLHSSVDVAVYTLNCLSAVNSAIILYQFTDSRLEMIKAQIDANVDVLVSEQTTFIITQTGLIELYRKALAHQPSQGALSEITGMEPSRISSTLLSFDTFLTNPDKYRLDQCMKISSTRLRDTIRERTIETVVAAYRIIYNKIIDPSNKYSQLSIKTVGQVQELLKVWM
uniref:Conserved oligomeric Golgi complex subunit 6 n=1 Tax=Wuchereria bancrofti TaxID=6293 RepID=A0AAF5Q2E1_WUCBA